MTKEFWRQTLQTRLDMLSAADIAERSQNVSQKLRTAVDWSRVTRLYCYQPITAWHEIDPSNFLDALRAEYPEIAITLTPQVADAPLPAEAFDVIIIPVLGYTRQGYRLGRGKGWYDRLLATQPGATTIGLAHPEGCIEDMPIEPHDQLLDIMITA